MFDNLYLNYEMVLLNLEEYRTFQKDSNIFGGLKRIAAPTNPG